MNRTLDQAAAVLGLKPRGMRRQLRELGVILADGTLASQYHGQGNLYMDPRKRWNPSIGAYSHYAVLMATERGIDWLAQQLDVTITVTREQEHAA